MKITDNVYNSGADYLDGPDKVEYDDQMVEDLWNEVRSVFYSGKVISVMLRDWPRLTMRDGDGELYDFEDDGWRIYCTEFYSDGDGWVTAYQKHSDDKLQIKVRGHGSATEE